MACLKLVHQKSLRLIRLRAGNFGNGHIYLHRDLDFFPSDSIGPSNSRLGKGKLLILSVCCFDDPVKTDIAGDKKIFRRRFWNRFFDHHRLEVGDYVAIEKISEYAYSVFPWIGDYTTKSPVTRFLTLQAEKENESYPSRYIPQTVRREVWIRDHERCVECGSQMALEFDHIILFSKGGSNTAANIQLLCLKCNRKKSASI